MSALKSVVLLDKIDVSAKNILSDRGINVQVFEKFTDIPTDVLPNLDGLIVRSATKVTADVMAKCPQLKIIGRAGTGVDNIDVGEATSRGIVVMNTPGGNTISAAEHTCFMIIALSRNAANNNATMKTHKWSKGMGNELMGKTLGIVGLGRIGTEVATRMQSFGMTTVGFDPIISAADAAKSNIKWLTLEEMWPLCDYITVHTPLIPQTKNLICSKTLSACKKGVKIINVARGGIVDEVELLEALNNGQCGGAGLDVFTDEPPKEWSLIDHPNVVATAHLGASTKEGQLKCGQEIANQFVDFSNKSTSLFGVINCPALVAAMSAECAPWLKLGIKLGQLLAAICIKSGTLEGKWSLEVSGETYPSNLNRFIISAVASGALKHVVSSVNLVNASSLAEKHGMKIELNSVSSQKDVQSELKLSVMGQSVSGVISNSMPYLTSLNQCCFYEPCSLTESNDNSCMFVGCIKQNDLSGLVGKLQSFDLGRIHFASKGDSLCVVGVCSNHAAQNVNELGVVFVNNSI